MCYKNKPKFTLKSEKEEETDNSKGLPKERRKKPSSLASQLS